MGGRRTTISIHAPREGGDRCLRGRVRCRHHFNPRPPRGGRRAAPKRPNNRPEFQSTPPARGATLFRFHFCFSYDKFQSTPPARGATPKYRIIPTNTPISIHAPREGGDTMIKYTAYILHHFNPRPPRGGRLHLWITSLRMPLFQSTPPARGATNNKVQIMPNLRFQSTPPARGATKSMLPSWERQYHFNPRPPRGGRHDLNLDWLLKTVKISIHAPREGGGQQRCTVLPADL